MKKSRKTKKFFKNGSLHLMMMPALILLLIYNYIPLAGNIMAFQKFNPSKGFFHSKWVGLKNFQYVFHLPDIYQVIWNTFYIAILKIIMGIVIPVIVALLLNEIRKMKFKRTIQTMIYFPHFLSWVILAGVFVDVLSPSNGVIGKAFTAMGLEPIFFLGDSKWFPYTMVLTDTWKEFGYGTIVYLAALTGIDPSLYEAAVMDGANRWKQTLHVTLPGILPIVMLMSILAMGNIFNAGFDQIFNMYSPQVYSTGDILDTLVYRIGMLDAQYGVATAIGLFKSVISFAMLGISYMVAYKYTEYRVF